MKRTERKAMIAFEEDFIEEVVSKAQARVKRELARIISTLLSSEEYEKDMRSKIDEYVNLVVKDEIKEAVDRVQQMKIDALDEILSVKKRAFLKLNNYTPSAIDEERMKAMEKTIESLRKEVEELKSRKSVFGGGSSTVYNMHGGQMCGTVHCDLVKVFGGQVIHLQTNKI